MTDIRPPDHRGSSLVNLIAELEFRFTSSTLHDRLNAEHAAHVGSGDSTVLVLFDGLGARQLDHGLAGDLRADLRGVLDAPFPSTTTVSLSTIATGRTPSEHGMLGYLMWLPSAGVLVNTIHMTSAWGEPIDVDLEGFLPSPNLWERLAAAGTEPLVVQPANFTSSPLTKVLYRGARFEGYWNADHAVDVTVDVASHPGRMVLLYVPFVDLAAHMAGQQSDAYDDAMTLANTVWRELRTRLPDSVNLIGTADHGHVDIPEDRRIQLSKNAQSSARLFGDGRALYVLGDPGPVLAEVPGTWIPRPELDAFWGPGPLDPTLDDRAPDGAIFLDEGYVGLTDVMNPAMVGHHGGVTDRERAIPLLARS